MKKLYSVLFLLLMSAAGFAQTCNPGFTWAHTPTGNNLLHYSFTNTSSVTPPSPLNFPSYTINYGDGSGGNNYFYGSATHNYAAPGSYSVIVNMEVYDSVTQALICSAADTQVINVAYTNCGTTITTVNQGNGVYQFTATTPGGIPPIGYAWDFGDGTTGTGSPITHTFAMGTFTVTLVATGGGCTYTNSTTIQNTSGAFNCANMSAGIGYNINNNIVYFSNTSSQANTPNIYRVPHWTFGDGGSSNGQNPTHTYTTGGVYTIVLINDWKDSITNTVLCTDTATLVLTVGNPPPPQNIISGNVYWDSIGTNPSTATFMVWLIVHDAVANTLTAVDSSIVTGWIFNGAPYSFSNQPAGDYLTKAAVLSGTPGATTLVPTYHDMSFYWNSALTINHTGGTSSGNHIHMQTGTPGTGPGFVGGNISLGANKGTSAGVPNLLVVLRDNAGQMVRFTYTDPNGNYSFGNVPTGTYNVFPEDMNYITIPSSAMAITNNNATFTGVNFKHTSTHIKPIATGINDLPESNLFRIHPNPSKGHVEISWTAASSETAQVLVSDMTGRMVFQQDAPMSKQAALDLSGLQSGMYFIRIITADAQHTEKMIISK